MQSRKNGQRHVWLLSGIGEGPALANLLIEQGWKVSVSVVSVQASWPYFEMSLSSLLVGPIKGIEGIKEVFEDAEHLHEGFDWVIDATHPFAVEISSSLQKACKEVHQPLLRFERPLNKAPRTYLIEDSKELANHSLQGRNILMALGARFLRETVDAAHQSGAKVFARVLPTPESLKQSLRCLLLDSHLAVIRPLKGRHVGDLERALCRRWSITDVVCRQSGGLTENLWQEICKDQNIKLWLVSRPKLAVGVEVFNSLDALLDHVSLFQ